MTLIGFRSANHPQQVAKRGAHTKVDDRATHPEDFAVWQQRFSFTLDVAAAHHNTKCAQYFIEADDGLSQSWVGERVWCNPPYSDIRSWVEKAWSEWRTNAVPLIVMLLPNNRAEQGWWQDLVEPYRDRPSCGLRVEFLRGRLRFIQAGRTEVGPNERPPFGSCLLIWGDARSYTPPDGTGTPHDVTAQPEQGRDTR